LAQAATHPTAAVFGSPANSLGSPLSWLLTAPQSHPENQQPRQSLSVNATAGFASSFFVSSHRQASVILAVGSRTQRLQTAPLVSLSAFCSHYPNASSRLFYPAQFHIISRL